MNNFASIKELINSLAREKELLSEMFTKRKMLSYAYDFALELVDFKEERIQYLLQHSVIRQNGNSLEIDDGFLQFFEQILDVNEEINTSFIDSNIENVRDNINYFFKRK